MKNKFFLLIICIFLTCISCKTMNVKDGVLLSPKKSEGFLFLSIVVNSPNFSVNIFPRNKKSDSGIFTRASAVFDKLYLGENFILIKLPSGKYTFKNIYLINKILPLEMEDIFFEVKQNKINYIGKLVIYEDEDTKEIKYFFSDDYDIACEYLRNYYPTLENMYPVENNTPERDVVRIAR